MNILVIGSGGREHALAWKLAQSEKCDKLFCAPGNPGMAELGTCAPIAADDVEGLVRFARSNQIDLTVVGPEIPLTLGIVDAFAAAGMKAWGPSKAAAELEASKVAMKEFLRRHNIPTAKFKIFDDPQRAGEYIDELGAPVVVKCDGLAAGKGVTVAQSIEEAHEAVDQIMRQHVFGAEAGKCVVIEECMVGEEISVFAICDGHNALICDTAQDHKQAYDGDKGPNTGGMGAFTPAPELLRAGDMDIIVEKILVPTLHGLVKENRPYVGVLYIGLMLTESGPKVVEYNVRFGDPECQPLMLRLQTDLVDVIEHSLAGTLDQIELTWDPQTAICVTLAAGGYPGQYPKGTPIDGLEEAIATGPSISVFHAGTALKGEQLVSAGGRVLSVCALGDSLASAQQAVYAACDAVQMPGKHLRRDIGSRHG